MELYTEAEQRPYSVLTRDGLRQKMEKAIIDISEIFMVSRSDATILLMFYRWNYEKVSEVLAEDKERVLAATGLIKSNVDMIDLNQDLSGSCCRACLKDCDEIEGVDDLISTPICDHKYCDDCLRKYLNFRSLDKNQSVITCPETSCNAAVGPITIEKLTVRDREMYERYVLDSYIADNMEVKFKNCPNCSYFIEFENHSMHDEYSLNVVCLCGYTFCWRCKEESHRPVTCNNAADWLSKDLKKINDAKTQSWIEANTKPCPSCYCPVQVYDMRYHTIVTCNCSVRFCVKCMKSEDEHINEAGQYGSCVAFSPEIELDTEKMSTQVGEICVDRWEAYQAELEQAKKDLTDFDNYLIKNPNSLSEQDMSLAREALMLVIQCRCVLKWSCVYDYFHLKYENSKKEYLCFLQEHATATLTGFLKTFLDETERAFKATTDREINGFRMVLTAATSNIGNYFYHFIKDLNEGLVNVKVQSYNGVSNPHWFCDRCTYANQWIHKNCQSCVDPAASSCGDNPSG